MNTDWCEGEWITWRCCLNRGICGVGGRMEQDDVGVVDWRGELQEDKRQRVTIN